MSDNAYNLIYIISTAVLLLGMAAVEIYRWRRGISGRIVEINADGVAFGIGEARSVVELESGKTVEAAVPGCVQCLGRLRPGDRVRINKTRDGYVVGLMYGFTRRKRDGLICIGSKGADTRRSD